MKIDLHMHSTFSDGTDAPVALPGMLRSCGITVFSLTDHDETGGGAEIRSALRPEDPVFITGVEFSCRDEFGKYHILGYNYDPDSKPMADMTERLHSLRMVKTIERLKWLYSEYGFIFEGGEIMKLLSLKNPGKPHIGSLIAAHGWAPDKDTAIEKYVSSCPYKKYIRPEEAISAITAADGIPILAHGLFGDGGQTDPPISHSDMEKRVLRLMEMGLKGLECFYSGFSPEQTNFMLELCHKNKLYVTAGSDYHGLNKKVPIGDTGPAAASDPSRVQKELFPFLATCGITF